jgi:hypothetical protein
MEKPLLSPVTFLEHSNDILPILPAKGIEIFLDAREYNGVPNRSTSFFDAIEAPFEFNCRI